MNILHDFLHTNPIFHEHIIRDDDEHNRICRYIEANMDNWQSDDENPLKPS